MVTKHCFMSVYRGTSMVLDSQTPFPEQAFAATPRFHDGAFRLFAPRMGLLGRATAEMVTCLDCPPPPAVAPVWTQSVAAVRPLPQHLPQNGCLDYRLMAQCLAQLLQWPLFSPTACS